MTSAEYTVNMSVKGPLPEPSGQIGYHWKIEKFFNLPIKDGTFLKSPIFLFSNAKWYLKIYPNGYNKTMSSGWINLYLCSSATTEHHVEYRLGILKADGSVFSSKCATSKFVENIKGWEKLLSREALLASKEIVAPNDTLTVFCTICMSAEWTIKATSKRPTSDSMVSLSEALRSSYCKKLCADITLKVQNREFYANKFILMTRSTVFASMFDHEMVEKHSGVVEIDDCDPASFEDFLLFLYTGDLNCVSSINAFSLYQTADKYDLEELKNECVQCMIREISVVSFCDVIRFASFHDKCHLLSVASDFFKKNAELIILLPKWTTLLEEKPSLGNELFSKYIKYEKEMHSVPKIEIREKTNFVTNPVAFDFGATVSPVFGTNVRYQ